MTSGKTDEMKGRVKEAVGTLIDDASLKREGKIDQVVGKVKQAVQSVIDKVEEVIS